MSDNVKVKKIKITPNERAKIYYEANKEKVKANVKKYQEEHLEYYKNYYITNREIVSKCASAYYIDKQKKNNLWVVKIREVVKPENMKEKKQLYFKQYYLKNKLLKAKVYDNLEIMKT